MAALSVIRAVTESAPAPEHPTILQLRIVNFLLPLLATAVTTIRLADRTRRRLLWWDDAWAAFACIWAIMLMIAIELHLDNPSKFVQSARVAIYYLCAHSFYLVAWSAKMSILFTVIRITPPSITRQILAWVAISFVTMYAVLFAQVFWVCERQPGWKSELQPQCALGRNVAIAQVICDVLSDAFIIVAPIRLIYRVLLSRTQKIRLIAIFSTTIVTTIVSMNHAAFVIAVGGLKEILAAIIQASISLIVANLSVVVALIFRISTEDAIHPTSLGVVSAISFGQRAKIPRRRKVNGVNLTTTTCLATEYESQLRTDDVHLAEVSWAGDAQESSEVLDKLDKLPVVATLATESEDSDNTLIAKSKS